MKTTYSKVFTAILVLSLLLVAFAFCAPLFLHSEEPVAIIGAASAPSYWFWFSIMWHQIPLFTAAFGIPTVIASGTALLARQPITKHCSVESVLTALVFSVATGLLIIGILGAFTTVTVIASLVLALLCGWYAHLRHTKPSVIGFVFDLLLAAVYAYPFAMMWSIILQ